ncbi:hypothetical protein ACWO4B_001314 [Clostridium sporogenes]
MLKNLSISFLFLDDNLNVYLKNEREKTMFSYDLFTLYVFRYYHHKRLHSPLGGLTPFENGYL